ncbi:MAG: hypothetical protein K0V04_36045 [Deltaproteobacteria bacterium]|nr:hypothetical protein [Deltaproteobacteria bacterium]
MLDDVGGDERDPCMVVAADEDAAVAAVGRLGPGEGPEPLVVTRPICGCDAHYGYGDYGCYTAMISTWIRLRVLGSSGPRFS